MLRGGVRRLRPLVARTRRLRLRQPPAPVPPSHRRRVDVPVPAVDPRGVAEPSHRRAARSARRRLRGNASPSGTISFSSASPQFSLVAIEVGPRRPRRWRFPRPADSLAARRRFSSVRARASSLALPSAGRSASAPRFSSCRGRRVGLVAGASLGRAFTERPHRSSPRGNRGRPSVGLVAGASLGRAAFTERGRRRAAPTMPALFAICAGTISVEMCSFGSQSSACLLEAAPPPTMNRSGENSLSR